MDDPTATRQGTPGLNTSEFRRSFSLLRNSHSVHPHALGQKQDEAGWGDVAAAAASQRKTGLPPPHQ